MSEAAGGTLGTAVPAYLIAQDRWLFWRTVAVTDKKTREKHGTKLPFAYRDTRKPCDAHDPRNWTGYAAITAALNRAPGAWDGPGFDLGVIEALGEVVIGLDLDACLDDGALAAWAIPFLLAMHSYAEVSPSLTGIKIIARVRLADLAEARRLLDIADGDKEQARTVTFGERVDGAAHVPGAQLFLIRRYFTVTGRHWVGSPDDVELLDLGQVAELAALFGPRSAATTRRRANGADREADDNDEAPNDAALAAKLDAELKANPKLRARWEGSTEGLKDTTRSGLDMSIVGLLVAADFTRGETFAALHKFRHGKVADEPSRYFDQMWKRTSASPPPSPPKDWEAAHPAADNQTPPPAARKPAPKQDRREEPLLKAIDTEEPEPETEPEPDGEDGPGAEWIAEPGGETGADEDKMAGAGEAKAKADIAAVPPDDVLNAIAELGPDVTRKMITDLFNKRFFVVNEGGKALVMWTSFDPVMKRDRVERAGFDDFRKFFSNRKLTVRIPGKRQPVTKSFGEWWLDDPGRRQYIGGVTFAPGAGPIPHTYNLWRDWTVKPVEGDWSLMQEHIHGVMCAGRHGISDYVMKWLAHMVQHPDQPGEIAIVVRGLKGVGKGIFGRWLLRLCGQHGLHIINAAHLTGRFTGHLLDVIFVLADEAFFAGDKQHEGILKGLITEDRMMVEPKYRTPVNIMNMLHLMMFSNNDWVIPASHDERRYLMLTALATYIGNLEYFAALNAQMENGGLAAMLYDLLNMDLGDFHPRKVPDTEELAEQKLHSMDSVHRWWAAVLTRGFVWKSRHGHPDFLKWDEFVTTELLVRSYGQWCGENRINYPAYRELLGKRLTEIYPPGRPRTAHPVYEADSVNHEDPQPVVKLGNQYGYKVGDIDNARALFSKVIGRAAKTSEWDAPVEDC